MAFITQQHSTTPFAIRALQQISRFVLLFVMVALPLFYLPYTQDVINLPKEILLATGVFITLFFWLLQAVQSKTVIVRRTVLDKALAVFLGSLILSSFVSLIPTISFLGKTSDFVFHTASIFLFIAWFYLLVQYVDNSKRWRTYVNALLLGATFSGLIFLFRTNSIVSEFLKLDIFNTVSSANSVFSIFAALAGSLSIGLLLVRGRSTTSQLLALICAVTCFVVLVRAGFTVGWGIYALGLGLVLIVGISFLRGTYIAALSVTFALFLISMLLIFVSTPSQLKLQLPVEVALGSEPTLDIAQQAFLHSAKTFLLGTGPGTFTQAFSLYRSPSFNASDVAWAVRFEHPYNVFYGILAETGLLGALSFVFIILLSIGSMLSAWLRMRPAVSLSEEDDIQDEDPIKIEVFVFVAVVLAATIGMGIAFYDLTLWWLWWTLLAMSIIGLSSLVPALIKEESHMLRTSPQYALASSFGLVLVVTIVVVLGVIGTRFYLADVAYAKATALGTSNGALQQYQRAVSLRPGYAPYLNGLAQAHFAKAQRISQDPSADPEELVAAVAAAINSARQAADTWENDVETWQTLGLMYRGAETLAPDSLQWAIDAFEKAIALEPTNALLHWQYGQVLSKSKQPDAAIESFEQAIRLKPNYIPATTDLARLHESQGNLDEAIAAYEPVFEIVANQPDAMFQLGRLFYNRSADGDLARAEQSWKRAVTLNPQYVNALYSLGLLYERNGDQAKALEYFERTQELVPDNSDVRSKVERLLAPVVVETPSEETQTPQ